MKKIIRYTLPLIALICSISCNEFDDTHIWDVIQDHEKRIAELERLCKDMNSNILSIKEIVEAINENDFVTSVSKIIQDGAEVGYIITFSKSGPVTIYHGQDGVGGENGIDGNNGKDGLDGHTPVIGVKMDSDGVYYWTLDGDWLTDENGNKIPTTGKNGENGEDGITPMLKIEEDYWYVSYDNGTTWTVLDRATGADGKDGESFFKSVDISDPDCIILTLANGQEIRIPTQRAFENLKAMVEGLNSDLESLQAILEVLQANDYVTGTAPILENGKEVGYTIYFSKSGSVNIYHGKDGKDGIDGKDGKDGEDGKDGLDGADGAPGKDGEDGKDGQNGTDGTDGYSPSIGVRKEADGKYYWTLDGEWMLDQNGNKILASGSDGKDGDDGLVPQLKIEEGYWYVSYDGGKTWENEPLGPSVDSSDICIFSEVRFDEQYLYLTLADGQEIRLPRTENSESFPGVLDPVEIDHPNVTFSGQLDIASEEFSYSRVTIYYSESDKFNVFNASSISTIDFDEEGRFTITLSGIEIGDQYKYCLCAEIGSSKYYTPVEELTIFHPYSELKDYDISLAQDLSAIGTANCYIISQGGIYKFKAVKGNTDSQIDSISSAEIIWETFGTDVTPEFFDLLEGVCFKDGYIAVKTSAEFKEGNALVAAKDSDGNILWSWHIWLTDSPAEQVYFNDAGTMMDRNLGATSATPGDVGALGLMYQWGRKDPFLGGRKILIKSSEKALSTITWPAAVTSDSITGTLEYATAHPTTFIKYNQFNQDWFYTDGADVDTTRWSVPAAPKSINDPCPYGWRIPDGGADGVWGIACNIKKNKKYTFDSTNKGMQMGGILGGDENIWYPAAGYLDHANANLVKTGSSGTWWSSDIYSEGSLYALVTYITTNRYFYVYNSGIRSRAFSARCIKEE